MMRVFTGLEQQGSLIDLIFYPTAYCFAEQEFIGISGKNLS